jgi:ATP-dependent Lon protease
MSVPLTFLKRAVVLAPGDAGARYALAEAIFGEGDAAGAIKQLERALALDPEHDAARRLLSRAYLKEGRRVPAERALEETVRRRPDDAGARDELAALLAEGGRIDDAIVHLEEACRAEPGHASRRVLLADLARRRGLVDRARRHLEHARRLSPGDAEIAARLHEIALETGDLAAPPPPPPRSRDFLLGRTRAALLALPLREATRAGVLAEVAAQLGRLDVTAAKRAVVSAGAAEQASAVLDLLRGEIALVEGNAVKAEQALRRAVERAPDLALAWARLGELSAAAGRSDDAVAAWERAVRLGPGDREALEQLGDALLGAGRRGEALARYQEAQSLRADGALAARIAALAARADAAQDRAIPGRIAALGWNATGGAVSPIEAAAVPGKGGELIFTGNVGKVGRDAGTVAWSCLKARAAELGIEEQVRRCDLHLHFVDTEMAKDGPSAGLALALAGLSALTARPLLPALAASGELTLHGAVRPVGGLHEKLTAAYLADLAVVIVPRKNLFELKSVPAEVVARLRIVYVDSLIEALAQARAGEGSGG